MAAAAQVPVTVLTGFLGSGKTTLLNNILRSKEHNKRFAVIENEFGEIGIDEKLLADKGRAKEDTNEEIIEVMNGCICCTVRGDLVQALKRLHARVKDFDGILIETTGMADPAPVAQTFFIDDDIKKMYNLDGIVTVVDAKHIVERLDEEKPEGAENESVEQIAFADRIILNKCDLMMDSEGGAPSKDQEETCKDVVEGEAVSMTGGGQAFKRRRLDLNDVAETKLKEIEKRIREHNPVAKIVRTQFSDVPALELLNLGGFDLERALEKEPDFLKDDGGEHVHDETVSSCSWAMPGFELNVNRIERWIGSVIQEFGADLYRYKGVLNVKGCDSKFIFQGVGMLFNGGFADDLVESPDKSAFWQPGETRECRFVFIGKHMKDKKDQLIEGFKACEAEKTLRFSVGDEVECRTGQGWQAAKVHRTWFQGNPYQIKIIGSDIMVWGPIDHKELVREGKKKGKK